MHPQTLCGVGLACLGSLLAPRIASSVQVETPAPIEIVKNVAYVEAASHPEGKDRLDIYRPKAARGAPVFVFIHGGALLQGDKDGQAHVGRYFAEHGILTVCINTRLSPEVSHPRHAEDAAAALGWVLDNIGSQGGDPGRVAVGGHSAGGYLAALLALDSRYLEAVGADPSAIHALVSISGFYWVERLAPSRPKTVWGEDVDVWKQASPARFVDSQAPPTLLLWADGDTEARQKQGRDLAEALTAAGASRVETAEIAERDHGSIWRRIGSPDDATGERIVEFLGRVLEAPSRSSRPDRGDPP